MEIRIWKLGETRNPKPETRNPKLETQNPKLETRNSKLETRNSKLETRNSKLETRNLKPEINSKKEINLIVEELLKLFVFRFIFPKLFEKKSKVGLKISEENLINSEEI